MDHIDDLSGNANNPTQTTASLKPYTGDATINGLNVLRTTGTGSMGLIFTSIDVKDCEIHAVVQPTSLGSDFTIVAAGGQIQYSTILNSGNLRTSPLTSPSDVQTGHKSGTAPAVLSFVYDSANSKMIQMVNGMPKEHSTAVTFPATMNVSTIGYQQYAKAIGYFGEIIITDSILSDSDRAYLVQYLMKKWGGLVVE